MFKCHVEKYKMMSRFKISEYSQCESDSSGWERAHSIGTGKGIWNNSQNFLHSSTLAFRVLVMTFYLIAILEEIELFV